jgi:hypothetical protein
LYPRFSREDWSVTVTPETSTSSPSVVFTVSPISAPQKRTEKLTYIHRNPVVRGLVEKPEDWPWSISRHCATGVEGAVEIESQWTAFRRGGLLPENLRYKEPAG